jgi:L-gulono-1,4-lactone dehydrogenase
LEFVLDKLSDYSWQNWSGSQQAVFRALLRPESSKELVDMLTHQYSDDGGIKVIGSSHSFSSIIAHSKSVVFSLENLKGIIEFDRESLWVEVYAGTTIGELNQALWDHGVAIENLGDIDQQTIGGAIATGTHGTGLGFQNLAGFVQSFTIATPLEGILTIARGDPLFEHMLICSWAFGLVVSYKLEVVPAFHLKLDMFPATLDEFENSYEQWNQDNRNAEVFWFPTTRATLVKLTNLSSHGQIRNRKAEWISNYIENRLFGILNEVNSMVPMTHTFIKTILARLLPRATKTDRSYNVYVTERSVRFHEMEYSLPLSALPMALKGIKNLVGSNDFPTLFPIEFRFVKKDNNSLSPAYGKEDRVYIAFHTYHRERFYEAYFRKAETLLMQLGGRPHWGKMFFAERDRFEAMYPQLDNVREIQRRFDPQSKFLTNKLKKDVF